ncbi:MAG: hypothetical protein JWQ07_5077, partial [Ramlibacter sp.]|nr:hypothetical protein [Ramlibacter sp.]
GIVSDKSASLMVNAQPRHHKALRKRSLVVAFRARLAP